MARDGPLVSFLTQLRPTHGRCGSLVTSRRDGLLGKLKGGIDNRGITRVSRGTGGGRRSGLDRWGGGGS